MAVRTGTTWQIRRRTTGVRGQTAVLRCPEERTTAKCRAKVVLHRKPAGAGQFRVQEKGSILSHNGHELGGLDKKRAPAAAEEDGAEDYLVKRHKLEEEEEEDDDEEERMIPLFGHEEDDEEEERMIPLFGHEEDEEEDVTIPVTADLAFVRETLLAVGGLNCEEIRRRYGSRVEGLQPLAYANPEYSLQRGRENHRLVSQALYRRSILKRVTRMESAQVFEQALRKHDRPYFVWWSQHYDVHPTSPCVFLRVHGASSIQVERSLMRLQKKYACLTRSDPRNSGHTRHALFTCPADPNGSALLVINVHALRTYRMLSVDDIAVNAAMPLAPLLVQFWGTKPTCAAELCQRRFGMLSVIIFLHRAFGHPDRMDISSIGYGLEEPGFELYEQLPNFLAMILRSLFSKNIAVSSWSSSAVHGL